jgi:hypothetical protein
MRLRFDRRVALAVLALAGVAIIATIAIARDPEPAEPASDPAARAELLQLARRQVRGTWLVEFSAVRRLASGRELPRVVTEANRPPLHASSAGGTVTVELEDEVITCSRVDGKDQCLEKPNEASVPIAEVYATVTRLGVYRVERAPSRIVAGETARCFRLVAQSGTAPDFGNRTESCWAEDGVPLYSRVERDDYRDTRTAFEVEREVPANVVDRLVAELEEEPGPAGG